MSGQDAAQTERRSILAYGGLILTYMLILQYGMWTLSGVTEEKSNRVMELLLAAARPWQLFAGKVAGTALLGLAQFAVTLTAALVAIRVTDAFTLPSIPADFVGVLVLWVLLGYATYLVLYGAAGALADKPEDAQTTTTPITLVVLTGFFASFVVLNDPSGLVARIGTFFPFWAPFTVPIRAALGALPLWQAVAAVTSSLATIVVMTVLSARVYRGGSLHTGGRLGWLEALRSART